MGALQVGGQARLMSGAMRKLAQSASRSRCTLVFLNQLRHKVGVLYGNPETTSGGQALKYYASVRIDVRAKGQLVEVRGGMGGGGVYISVYICQVLWYTQTPSCLTPPLIQLFSLLLLLTLQLTLTLLVLPQSSQRGHRHACRPSPFLTSVLSMSIDTVSVNCRAARPSACM